MSSVLRLFLAGLIAFVPSPDNKSVQAFLVQADRGAVFDGCPSPRHFPVLAVAPRNVVSHVCTGSGRLVSLSHLVPKVAPGKNVRFCVWDLVDVEVRLAGRLDEGFEKVEKGRGRSGFLGLAGQDKLPGSSNESVDFSWLANIDGILPDGGNLREGVGNGSDRDGVAAKITVDRGKLEVCHLVQQKVMNQAVVPAFRFVEVVSKAEVSYNQALADVVIAQSRMESDRLYVLLVDERTGLVEEFINLEAGGDSLLDILLLNMSREHGSPSANCAQRGSDFARFFPLANYEKAGDDSKYLPHITTDVQDPSVQPNCDMTTLGRYLGLEVVAEEAHHRKRLVQWRPEFDDLAEYGTNSLETRSICPMSTF